MTGSVKIIFYVCKYESEVWLLLLSSFPTKNEFVIQLTIKTHLNKENIIVSYVEKSKTKYFNMKIVLCHNIF